MLQQIGKHSSTPVVKVRCLKATGGVDLYKLPRSEVTVYKWPACTVSILCLLPLIFCPWSCLYLSICLCFCFYRSLRLCLSICLCLYASCLLSVASISLCLCLSVRSLALKRTPLCLALPGREPRASPARLCHPDAAAGRCD